MAKPVANIPLQLKRLEIAKGRVATLPAKATLKSTEMAAAIGVRWPTLRDWCDQIPGFEESKAFNRGGNGVEWAFRPKKTVDYLARYLGKIQSEAAKKQLRLREMVGGSALAGAPEEFSLDELNKMIGLSIKVQEQLERQGKLMDADKVRTVLTALFSSIQQAAMRAAMEQDLNGQWPAEIRESFETAMRSVLTSIERAARDCLKALTPSG